ncbi:MAG: hypothetical protein ACTHJ3_08030 [Pararhizobium sp.]
MILVSITAHLMRPAVIDGPIHLDAILTARHPAMHGLDGITRKSGRARQAPLPLCVARSEDRKWVWCASAWVPGAPDAAIGITKRRDAVDYRMINRTVNPSVGPERNRLLQMPIYRGPMTWHAVVSKDKDINELRRLLRRVAQIGKLRKSGYGLVERWDVETEQGDLTQALLVAGRCARVLPVAMVKSSAPPASQSVLPPYWAEEEATPCYLPGAAGELADVAITLPTMLR